MSFIKGSVGAFGANFTEDVKIIQWLLNQANLTTGFTQVGNGDPGHFSALRPSKKSPPLLISKSPGIQITGAVDGATQRAINDFAKWCGENQIAKPIGFAPNAAILPDDILYKKLIWTVVQTFAPETVRILTSDYSEPRIKEALDGRISFVQFQYILEHSRHSGLSALGGEMQKLLANPRVFAFLDLISKAETWLDERFEFVPYDMKVGFIKLPNLYQHPGVVAGHYQIKTETWNTAKSKCGLYDFTPESQDIAAVYLLSTLPYAASGSPPYPPGDKILPFVLKGGDENVEYAIELCSGTWASFPTKYEKKDGKWILKSNFARSGKEGFKESRYSPQHCAPLESLINTYNKYLNNRGGK